MTQYELAQRGELSPQMIAAAESEGVAPEFIRAGLAAGTLVLPANHNHLNLRPCAIGMGLRIKVNANIGASTLDASETGAQARLEAALAAGADSVMDLSTAGDLRGAAAPVAGRLSRAGGHGSDLSSGREGHAARGQRRLHGRGRIAGDAGAERGRRRGLRHRALRRDARRRPRWPWTEAASPGW